MWKKYITCFYTIVLVRNVIFLIQQKLQNLWGGSHFRHLHPSQSLCSPRTLSTDGGGGGTLRAVLPKMKFKRGLFLIRYQWFYRCCWNGMIFPWASGGSAPLGPHQGPWGGPLVAHSDRNWMPKTPEFPGALPLDPTKGPKAAPGMLIWS